MARRILSLFIALILSLSLLPTPANAIISVSGGGTGTGGLVGSGTWSQQRQGLRITIVDKDGNYALKYGSSLSLDLLYNWANFLKNGIYVGGCKLADGGTNPPHYLGTNLQNSISSISDTHQMLPNLRPLGPPGKNP